MSKLFVDIEKVNRKLSVILPEYIGSAHCMEDTEEILTRMSLLAKKEGIEVDDDEKIIIARYKKHESKFDFDEMVEENDNDKGFNRES